MTTTEPTGLAERLAAYADTLVEAGAIDSSAIREAFAAVPRHRFVSHFFDGPDEHVIDPKRELSEELLARIYSDRALLTSKGRDGGPPSTSSAPGLMARMLEALELVPGLSVLEVGAGTGYNAALIHRITGEQVVTVEAGECAAAEATTALRGVGLEKRVRVVHGDGYEGWPEGAPYDRIVVTCGIAGIPPGWLDQLADEGLVVAPAAHGGTHPVVTARRETGSESLRGRGVVGADFMHAVGRLRPAALFPDEPHGRLPVGEVDRRPGVVPALEWEAYQDLRCWLGACDARITRAVPDREVYELTTGSCALVDAEAGAAWVHTDGSITLAGEPGLAEELVNLVWRWDAVGRPSITDWDIGWRPAADPTLALLTPAWQHPALAT